MTFYGKSSGAKRAARAGWLALAAVCGMVLLAGSNAVSAGGGDRMAAASQSGGDSGTEGAKVKPEFTEEFLNDPAVIEAGKAVWHQQCRHCHGHAAYPGKAPKLQPSKLTPDFAYDRVTNGFRKMPSWKDVFTKEERMSVVAYVLSKSFSP